MRQLNEDAVIAAIEGLKSANGNPDADAETECHDAALHKAIAAIRALPDAWRPIEDAPRNVWLLAWGEDTGFGVARYPFNIIGDENFDFTHWQPMPSPPEGD
jgi:hypothetical protein